MSEPTPAEPQSPLPPPLPAREGCLTAVMMLAGILLLLPGLCSLWGATFIVPELLQNKTGGGEGGIVLIWLSGFAIAAVGILLIRAAIRGPRR